MALIERRHESGLVLAEDAMDEAALSRALKRLRPDFSLQKRPVDEENGGVTVYKVVHVPTGRVAFSWIDDYGRPLPLSSGLLDEFQRHLLGERGNSTLVTEDEHNRRLVEQTRRSLESDSAAIIADHQPRLAGRLSVSLAYRNRKPAHLKRHRGRVER